MRGLKSRPAAMELLASLLAKWASQEFVFADMACIACESGGNYQCLCCSMSKDLIPAHTQVQL